MKSKSEQDETTTIAITKGDRKWLKGLGRKGDSYHDILQMLRKIVGDKRL